MTSGNDLTVTYTSYNKTASIKRGTTEIAFAHDPEHNRYSQLGASGETLYLSGPGVLAERHAGVGSGEVRWTNCLIIGGRLIGVYIQKADETSATAGANWLAGYAGFIQQDIRIAKSMSLLQSSFQKCGLC